LDNLDEPEAKAAMIWIIGQYADRIENADVLLDDFLYTFLEEPVEVRFTHKSLHRITFCPHLTRT
jgi:vesicle coat complex subunit